VVYRTDTFNRTFSDDSGYPIFLFEWALILFKTGRLKETEKKIFIIFDANHYLLDKFLGRDLIPLGTKEFSNLDELEYADFQEYSHADPEFADFAEWLEHFVNSHRFIDFRNEVIRIGEKLAENPTGQERSRLLDRKRKLIK
jgi:hypothetical protein